MGFLSNVYTVFIQVASLAVLVAVGVLCDKTGIFTEKAARMSNDLLFYVVIPCVIVDSFMSVEYSAQNSSGFLITFLCAAAFHIVAAIVIRFMFNKGNEDETKVLKYAVMYANMGYMGIPLCKSVLQAVSGNGELGVFYCSSAVAVFNIFCFTHGIKLMSKSEYKLSFKNIILNPGTVSVLIGLPLFYFRIKLPGIIHTPVSQLGSMNTPLAMVMFGTYLSKANISESLKDKRIYVTALFKLILLPAVMISLFRLCGVRGDILTATAIVISAPTAGNTVMFAAKYGRDTALASETSGFVTILSVITMPLLVAFALLIG